jgi:hypothetical protein
MEGYQDRLLAEYADLEERTNKLAAFAASPDYWKVVSVPERDYLDAQLPVMQRYLAILASRVAMLPTAKEEATYKEEKKAEVKEEAKVESKKDAPAKK